MNAIGISILLALIIVVLASSKRGALMAMMAGVLFLTQAQQISVGGFNMFAIRFLELAGFVRVLSRKELSFSNLNGIDRAILTLYCYTTVIFLVRSNDSQAYEIGLLVDAFLCYFTFRALVRNVEDLEWFLGALVLLLLPFVALVLIESRTSTNPFIRIGGIAATDEWFREGRIRCFATFAHPSLLGTLGGSFIPIYMGQLFTKRRVIGFAGVVLCFLIIWAANSGGPMTCLVVSVIGWSVWPLRKHMQWVRRGLVALIVLLDLSMQAPIWYVLMKFSELTGGDGWHRSYLMDVAFHNIGKWWLIGMPLQGTVTWFPYLNGSTGAADITNVYIWFGLQGGLLSVFLFVTLLVRAFRNIGNHLAALRSSPESSKGSEYLFWGLGVMLAVHLMNWFGITYYDQTFVVWFMQLAIISTLTENAKALDRANVAARQATRSAAIFYRAKPMTYPVPAQAAPRKG
jgi:hypothetical protein